MTGAALDGSVQLAWQPSAGATAYTVYRGTTPTAITQLLTPTTGIAATSFSDTTAVNGTTYYYRVRSVVGGIEEAAVPALSVQATPRSRACSTGNVVVRENCFSGDSGWRAQNVIGGIEGFATATSVNRGESVDIKVKTGGSAAPFEVQVYRSGYYGGAGARLFSTIRGLTGVGQPTCFTDAPTGLLDCSNWSTSLTVTTTASWPSGVYLLRLVRTDTGADNHVLLVVRDDGRASDILFGTADTTYQAYNNYGGKSLYDFNSSGAITVAGTARAVKVSFDRPYVQPGALGLRDWYARQDYQQVYWLESQGYDVAYISDTDLETRPAEARLHKAYWIPAHDEYYSAGMRGALEQARDAGVSLFSSGANEIYWKIRFETSPVSGRAGRVQVTYKSTQSGGADPSGIPTGTWRDPNGANKPENALLGTMYVGDNNGQSFPWVVSATQGSDRVYRNTPLQTQPVGTSTSMGRELVGWEWDARVANGFEPAGVVTVASRSITGSLIQGNGAFSSPGTTTIHSTKYSTASGALVFATGTNYWTRGLAFNDAGVGEPDQRIQQIAYNVLADMNVQPATPSAAIVLSTPGTRPAAPTGVSARGLGTDSAEVSWTAVAGATGYNVYRAALPRTNGEPLGTRANGTLITGTTFTDIGLTSSTTYYYVVTAVSGGEQSVASAEAAATTAAASGEAVRINAGGSQYVSSTGQTFRADTFFTGGSTHSTSAVITGTADPSLYQRERWGQFSYAIPITNGTYDVRFHFVEIYYGTAEPGGIGKRVFGMDVLDTATSPDLANIDVFAAVGANAAHTLTVPGVSVADGTLDIRSVYGAADDPEVAAIEVVPSGEAPPPPPPPSAPAVDSTTPANGATNVSTLAKPHAVFSKDMNASTITGSTFTLSLSDGTPVPGSVSYDATLRRATFVPTAPLGVSTAYTARLAPTVAGADGTQIGTAYTWTFTTAATQTKPFPVTSTTPADGAGPVARTTTVTAVFSKDVDTSTLTTTSFSLTGVNGTPVPATVSYAGATRTATLTPAEPLAPGTDYTARLDSSIEAVDGTPLAGPVIWTFFTAGCPCSLLSNTLRPENERLAVQDGRTGTGPWSYELGVRFTVDQPMRVDAIEFYKASGEIGIHTGKLWTAAGVEIARVDFVGETGQGWQRQAFATPPVLQAGEYLVSVNANEFFNFTAFGLSREIISGPLRSIADNRNGVFGSAAGVFPTQSFNASNYFVDVQVSPDGTLPPPSVVSRTPADLATGVERNVTIQAVFSAPLNPDTVNGSTFSLRRPDSSLVPATVTYDRTTRTATLTPIDRLAFSTTYRARLTSGIRSSDGQQLAGAPVEWSFTVKQAAPPQVTYVVPADASTDAGTGVLPRARFSVPLDPATVNASTFTITGPAGPVAGTVSYDASQQLALFTPFAPLTAGASYTGRLDPGIATPDGAALGTAHAWTFQIAATPQPPPALASTNPAHGATYISRSAPVTATFNRSIDPATLMPASFKVRGPDGVPVSASVSYDAATRTAILTPAIPLEGGLDFTARIETTVTTVDGEPLPAPAVWGFATAACPCSLFTLMSPLSVPASQDNQVSADGVASYEMGVKVILDQQMRLTGFRYYKSPTETGIHTGKLWTAGGLPLAQATFVGETASGWQYQALAETVLLQPNTVYVISVNLNKAYAFTSGGLAQQIISGPVRSVADGANGVFRAPAGSFPTQSFNSSNYFVDLEAIPDPNPPPPPTATAIEPADGAVDIVLATNTRATFSRPMDPATVRTDTFTLERLDGTGVAGTVAYNDTTSTATLTPSAQLAYGKVFISTLNGPRARDGSALNPISWTFTTDRFGLDDPAPGFIRNGQTVSARLGDWSGAGIREVEFRSCAGASCSWAAGTAIGSDTASPYSLAWTGQPADGQHTVVARATSNLGEQTGDSRTVTVTVDNTAPITATQCDAGSCAGWFRTSPVSLTLAATDGGSGLSQIRYTLDGSDPSPVSGLVYSGPISVAATTTVKFRAYDTVGNEEAVASQLVRIDTVAPETAIDAGPANPSNSSSATFTFSSNEAGSTFEYSLDGGLFAPSVSPLTLTGLADGAHTLAVRATDPAGNTDATAAGFTWTIDTVAPDTTIGSAPAALSGSASATFTVSSSEAGSTFEYSLDGGAYTATASPLILTGLADGSHTVSLRSVDAAGNRDATPAAHTWTVDTTAPATTIDSSPAAATSSTSATFAFSSNEAGSTFAYSLDGSPYTTAISPVAITGLTEGAHTFSVRATDQIGNTDATPATFTWTVDTTAPTTTIDSGPPNRDRSSSATFTFSSNEADATFEYSLDSGPYTPATSPLTLEGLADGNHTFAVRAVDRAGNRDATPATQQWKVDKGAPDTTIDSAPPTLSNSTSATFAFSSTELGSTFEYSLDGGAFTAASSPLTLTGLGVGSHTFSVRATDEAGNTDLTPATHTWTVDLTAPDTTIDGRPADPSSSSSATFTFSSTEAGSTFEYSLDGGAYTVATSPLTLAALADGSHTFSVRARDGAGNVDATPATFTWRVDTVAPNTTIDSSPSAVSASTSATFAFSSTEPGSTFAYSIDGAPYIAGTSPVTLTALADGSHTFSVRATDTAGNTDATPASYTWRVDTVAPQTTIDSAPATLTSSTSATFGFSSSETGSSFQYSLDGGPYTGAVSPLTLTGLVDGSHTFSVRASDAAGNQDATPASFTWTVDTRAPETVLLSSPASPTSSTSATFTFTADESATFAYSVDGGPYTAGTSPVTLTGLADGSHTFSVRATDAAGNTDATPATFTWVVDTVAPNTSVDAGPSDPTNATSATFAFSSSEGSSTFAYSVDGGPYTAGTSPVSLTGLADGSHTFSVRATDAAGNTDATPATFTWRVDTVAPNTTIDSAPAALTTSTSATFAFSSGETGSSFQYSVDGGPYTAGTSPVTLTALADGSHTFSVRATDAAGNTDATPATHTWTVDTVAPTASITASPPLRSNSRTASFSFVSNEAASTFEVSLDGSIFAAATSPATYTALADGPHTFRVQATDAAGNTGAAELFTWTIDTVAPNTTIDSAPPAITSSTSATFAFSSSETGSTFQYSVDGGAYTTGTSPITLTGLTDGSHSFSVRATDSAGNTDSTPATHTWTVGTGPDTTLTSSPPSPSSSSTATFAFTSNQATATFEVSLDGAPYTTATTPYTLTALADGSHTFSVRAVDEAGNVDASPATHTWTVDTAAPNTTIDSSPPAVANSASATFAFSSSEAGSTFAYSLDGGPYTISTSPVTLTGLADGSHTFSVRATDGAGNTDASPATYTWTVDTVAPDTTIDSKPDAMTTSTTATFAFSSSEPGSTFAYSVDGGVYTTGTSPVTLTGLAHGNHTFSVRATDDAGNADATPATYNWLVDTTAPTTPVLSFSSFTNASATNGTVYFRPGATGGFTVAASATDAESGIASTSYPSLGSGWTGTGGTYSFGAAAIDPVEPLSVTVRNGAGASSTTSFTVTPDAAAPTTTIACAAGACSDGWYTTSTVSVTLASTDPGSGVASTRYTTDGSDPAASATAQTYAGAFSLSTTTTVRFAATDKVGNVETAGSRTIRIDSTAPTAPALTFGSFTNASTTGTTVFYRPGVSGAFTATASSSDPESGVASTTFPALGSGWTNTGGSYSFAAGAVDPVEPLNVTATNGAGLSAGSGFTVTSDSTAPTSGVSCNGAACGSGWYSSSPVSVSLSASDLASGVAEIRYTTDGSDPSPLNGQVYAAPFQVFGSLTVKFRAYDRVGNEELVGSQQIRIDTTPPSAPTIGLSEADADSHAAGTTLYYNPSGTKTGTFTVTASSTDAESGIDRVSFPAVTGMTGGGDDAAAPYAQSYSWTATTAASGAQTVTARNPAGLTSSGSFTLTPDTTAPTGGAVSYADGYDADGSVTVTTTAASDAGSGIASSVLERQIATLSGGVCGTFGAWSAASSPNTVPDASCAKYRLRVTDNVGNVATFGSANVVKVDLAPPTAPALTLSESETDQHVTGTTLYYNPSGSNSGSFTATATSSAASGIAKIGFPSVAGMTGGGDDATSPYSSVYSWTATTAASGAQSVTATSNAGRTSSSAFTLTPDTAAPTGGSVSYADGYDTDGSVTVTTATGTDAGSGVNAASGLLERQTATLSNGVCGVFGAWTAASAPDTVANGLCVRYRYSVADHVGNSVVYTSPAVVKVDTTAPAAPALSFGSFTKASATGGTVFFNTTQAGGFTVTAAVSDPESGIASTSFPTLGTGWTHTGGAYSFTTGAADPAEPLAATATNNAGLTSAGAGFTVTGDGAGPAGGSVDYTDGYRTTASVALTLADGADALSGVDTDFGSLERSAAPLSDGACGTFAAFGQIASNPALSLSDTTVASGSCYRYRYVVSDKVGNQTTFTSVAVAKIDTVAPTATMADPGQYLRGTVTLGSTQSDLASGIATVTYQRSPAGLSTWTDTAASFDTTLVADGLYDLRVVVTDRAGNSTSSAAVTGRQVDNTLPTISLTDPGANLRGTVSLVSTQSDGGSGIDSVTYQYSPAGAGTWTDTTASWNTSLLADGLYDLRAVARDRAGNQAISEVTGRRVDNTAPAATLNSPGAKVRGTVTLTSSTSDGGSGLASVRYELLVGTTWTEIAASWDTTTAAEGSQQLRVVATDRAGNSTASAAVSTVVDNSAPVTSARTPADGAGGVATGTTVTATFNKDMATATITATSFTLSGPSGAVAAAVSYDAATRKATLTPNAPLGEGTSYTARLAATITASDGEGLYAPESWTFSTGVTPVTVTDKTPADGATGVATSVAPTATFSKAMDAATITSSSFTLTGPSGAVAATVSYDAGTRKATLTPSAALAGGATYTARLETTIKSSDGVALASAVTWSFTTEAGAPTVTAKTPADGATDASRTAKPTATFSRDMDATTITSSSFTLTGPSGAVAATVAYDAATRTATLTPSAALTGGTTYTARLDTTIKGANGAPLASAYSWSFTVLPAPVATAWNPSSGAVDVATDVQPNVTFSRAMDSTTFTATSVTVKKPDGTVISTNRTWWAPTNTLYIAPVWPLDYSKTYTVTLDTTVKALDGEPLAAPVTFSFTTTGDGVTKRINSGGGAYTTTAGAVFAADGSVSGGLTRSVTNTITGTTDPALYQDERYGSFTYTIKVPNGTYDVKLHFAETLWTSPSKRIFDIDVLETTVLPDIGSIDLISLVGANRAWTPTIANVTVTSGVIRIKTIAKIDQPVLSALEVLPKAPAVSSTSPTANATGVSTTTVKATFSRAMDASTISTATFSLRAPDGTLVPGSVSYDATSKTATFTPSVTLARATKYTATVERTVRDSNGMNMAGSHTWSFTTK